jgi:hypothetical protein
MMLTLALTVVVPLTVDPEDGDVMVTIRPPNCPRAGSVAIQTRANDIKTRIFATASLTAGPLSI